MFIALTSQYIYAIAWLAVMIFCIIAEALTVQFVSVWFAIGALVASVLGAFNVSFTWQLIAFVVVSFIALVVTRPLIKKIKDKKFKVPGSSDSLVGATVVVLNEVTPEKVGTVKAQYDTYGAVSLKESFSVGESALVSEVRGNKVVINKL